MDQMTIQTETGTLKQCFVKHVRTGFEQQNKIDRQWRDLNYLENPNFSLALKEYEYFEQVLSEAGVQLHYLAGNDADTIDSIYCRDAAIFTDRGAVLCRMGKPARSGEPDTYIQACNKSGIGILGRIQPPGILEGGDVAWLNRNTLAVGHGYRSNQSGFDQLNDLLSPYGITCIQVDLPHFKGPSDVFHLMSVFSPVDRLKAVVYSPLMPVRFRNFLLDCGWHLIEVWPDEFEALGCNVLALAPGKCLMVNGLPKTRQFLESEGLEVLTYPGRHISYLGGGGPTCLTRPIVRTE